MKGYLYASTRKVHGCSQLETGADVKFADGLVDDKNQKSGGYLPGRHRSPLEKSDGDCYWGPAIVDMIIQRKNPELACECRD